MKKYKKNFIYAVKNCHHKDAPGTAAYLQRMSNWWSIVGNRSVVTQKKWPELKQKIAAVKREFESLQLQYAE